MWRWAVAALVAIVAGVLVMVLGDSDPPSGSAEGVEAEDPSGPLPAPVAAPANGRVVPVPDPPPAGEEFTLPSGLDLATLLEDVKRRDQWVKELKKRCIQLARDRKYDQARECLELQLAINPDDPDIHLNLGIVAAMRGDKTEAYHRYQKYLELDPEGVKARQVEMILQRFDEVMAADDGFQPARSGTTERSQAVREAMRLYEEAYVIKGTDSRRALLLLDEAFSLLPEDHPLRDRIDRLQERIESGGER